MQREPIFFFSILHDNLLHKVLVKSGVSGQLRVEHGGEQASLPGHNNRPLGFLGEIGGEGGLREFSQDLHALGDVGDHRGANEHGVEGFVAQQGDGHISLEAVHLPTKEVPVHSDVHHVQQLLAPNLDMGGMLSQEDGASTSSLCKNRGKR